MNEAYPLPVTCHHMRDFSCCIVHSQPPHPSVCLFSRFMYPCVRRNWERQFNWGRKFTTGEGVHESLPLGREQQAMSKPTGDLACHSSWEGSGRLEKKHFGRDWGSSEPAMPLWSSPSAKASYLPGHLKTTRKSTFLISPKDNENTSAVRFQCKWVPIWLCPQGLGRRKQHYKVRAFQRTSCVSVLFTKSSFMFMIRQVCLPSVCWMSRLTGI